MRAGRLRERVEVEEPQATHDAEGGPSRAPVKIATIWVRRVSGAASDQEIDGERVPEQTLTWEARYRSDLSSGMELVERSGARHEIVGDPFDPDGRRERLQIETVRRG